MGEGTTPGCLPSSATATGVAETDMTVAAAGDDVATAIEMLRATRTRKPARSISISVRLVSSSSNASSRISELSSLFDLAAVFSSGWRAMVFNPEFWREADTSGFCLDPNLGGKAVDREPVTVDAKAAQRGESSAGSEGVMTEVLACIDVADVHFDRWSFHRHKRIVQRDRRVGVSPGVDDDPGCLAGMGLVDEVDQLAFSAGLPAIGFQPEQR